ncbi:MAG: hypothetical protein AAB316_15800, partial [Bacteroidota bacterium]
MKNTLRTLLFLLLPAFPQAQITQWGFDFNLVEQPCPFDSSVSVLQPASWLVYQTLDGTWNGTVDSSKCLEMEAFGSYSARIKLNQIDPTKPLFLRRRFLGAPVNLMFSNMLHRSQPSVSTSNGLQVKTGTNCPDELCTGLITVVEIPDEAGTGKAQRIHRTAANWSPGQNIEVNACLATEKFAENYLHEVILKITPSSSSLAAHHLTFPFFFLEAPDMDWNGISTVSKITALPQHFNGTTYELNISETAEASNAFENDGHLFLYTAGTYPSAANYSYIEAMPEPNSPEHQTINLYVEWWQSAVFQPFVQLRGGLLEGSDSLRHTINLINDGGEYCFSSLIDLIFEDDVNFLYLGGQVNFAEANSCMMFRNGGSLKVGDDATFYYGYDGVGMLGLGSGGSIELGKNGKLVVDNRMMLTSFNESNPNLEISVELNP